MKNKGINVEYRGTRQTATLQDCVWEWWKREGKEVNWGSDDSGRNGATSYNFELPVSNPTFPSLTLGPYADYGTQLLYHLTSGHLLHHGLDRNMSGQNGHDMEGADVKGECDIQLERKDVEEFRNCLEITENFLIAIDNTTKNGSEDKDLHELPIEVRRVCEALQKWVKLGRVSLQFFSCGLPPEKESTSANLKILYKTLCSYISILVRGIVGTLQWAWHASSCRRIDGHFIQNGDSMIQNLPSYLVEKKRTVVNFDPKSKIAQRLASHGLDSRLSRYPILYGSMIITALICPDARDDDLDNKCLAALAHSNVSWDWLDNGLKRVNELDDFLSNWLALTTCAGVQVTHKRIMEGDFGGAIRLLMDPAFLETKSKIELAFKTCKPTMVSAVKMAGAGFKPTFTQWCFTAALDAAFINNFEKLSLKTCPSFQNEVVWLLLYNDVIDYKNDLSGGEIRNFLDFQCAGRHPLHCQLDRTLAITIGVGEYLLQNQSTLFNWPCFLPSYYTHLWHLLGGRYNLFRTYMLNIFTFLKDPGAHAPVRVKYDNTRKLLDSFTEDFQPKIEYSEMTLLSEMSRADLIRTCGLYMGVTPHDLTRLLTQFRSDYCLRKLCEGVLKDAGVLHGECIEKLVLAVGSLQWKGLDSVAILALESMLVCLRADGMFKELAELCTNFYARTVVMAELFVQVGLSGGVICPGCSRLYGGWVDETATEVYAHLEEVLSGMSCTRQNTISGIILGALTFGLNYMRVPVMDLHLQANIAVVGEGLEAKDVGDIIRMSGKTVG